MSTHAAQPSTVQVIGGVEQQPLPAVVVTSTMVAPARDAMLDAQAENDRQRLLAYNPDPEVNSRLELLPLLLKPGVDRAAVVARLLELEREGFASNERERGHERDATGPLDQLTALLYLNGQRGLTIKQAAKRLRDPLRVVKAECEKGPGAERDGIALFHAHCRIKDVIGEVPVATLRSESMARQLRGLHDVLCALLTDGAPAEEAA